MAFGYNALSHVVHRTGIALYPAHLRSPPNAKTSSDILRFPCCDQLDLYVARAGSQDCLQEDLQRVAVSGSPFLLFFVFLVSLSTLSYAYLSVLLVISYSAPFPPFLLSFLLSLFFQVFSITIIVPRSLAT
jgi:hypothetical protein